MSRQGRCDGLPIVHDGVVVEPPDADPPYAVGTALQVRCHFDPRKERVTSRCTVAGEKPDGSATAVWDPDAIFCAKPPCFDRPPNLRNGRAVLHAEGDVFGYRYECDDGFELEGTANYRCVDGRWEPRKKAKCIPNRNAGGKDHDEGESDAFATSGTSASSFPVPPERGKTTTFVENADRFRGISMWILTFAFLIVNLAGYEMYRSSRKEFFPPPPKK